MLALLPKIPKHERMKATEKLRETIRHLVEYVCTWSRSMHSMIRDQVAVSSRSRPISKIIGLSTYDEGIMRRTLVVLRETNRRRSKMTNDTQYDSDT